MKALLPSFLMLCISLPLAIFYPYGNSTLQMIAMNLAFANFFTLAIPLYYFRNHPEAAIPKVIVAFVAAISSLFICTTRKDFDELIPMEIDGKVISLYRSNNHNYPGVDISDTNLGMIKIEPVTESLWKNLSVGDHLTKQSFSLHFVRGKERLPAVSPSILHSVRGANF